MHELTHLFNPLSYLHLFKEIVRSLARPTLQEEKPPRFQYLRIVIMVFLISMVFKVFALFINLWVENQFGFDHETPGPERSIWLTLLFVGFAGPIVEELIFRLPMRLDARNLSVALALGAVFFVFGKWINQQMEQWASSTDLRSILQFLVKMSSAAVLAFLLSLILRGFDPILVAFGKARFPWVFYLLTVVFGFAHVSNFQFSGHNLLYIVPLTLPQIIGGLFLGYTRYTFGLKYAVLQHSCGNLLTLLPALLIN
ncbi:MAG: CPBP family intramembrane metalloprotease [Saprospiraceae bacterium]|nr:CPBP family intramembrane metalloprotease [Saprospiraceae bacterium]